MSAAWPAALPGAVWSSMSGGPDQAVMRSDADGVGPVQRKRRSSRPSHTYELAWRFSNEEWLTFEDWYRMDLRDGCAWFAMPVPVGDAIQVLTCHFEGPPSWAAEAGGGMRVSGRIEARDWAVAPAAQILMAATAQATAHAGPQNLSTQIRLAAAPAASAGGSASMSKKANLAAAAASSARVTADIRPAVDLEWDAPVGWTPAGYRVKWGTSSGTYTSQQDVGAGVLLLSLFGLAWNTLYYWVVVGLDGVGAEQTPSAESTFSTPN